jgi:membrane protease YdiL (CAAX protease family)
VELLILLFGALLVVGACWPVWRASPEPARLAAPVVLGLGLAAFAVGRLLGGGEAPGPAVAGFIALNTLAAVAEEAFFRRFLYDTLLAGGAAVAVLGSAALFAVVHVTIYGPAILPVDIAAGLLLSWQRWASGSWHIPAVTHVAANLLVVI